MADKFHILVVEDDLPYAELLDTLLSEAGYVVTVANTLREARWMADSKAFKAITVDLHMPDARGDEVLSEIRRVAPHVPVIVLSGTVTEKDYMRLVSIGADACIQKPTDTATVVALIDKAVRMRDDRCCIQELHRCYFRLNSVLQEPLHA